MSRKSPVWVWALVILSGLALLFLLGDDSTNKIKIEASDFYNQLKEGKISEVVILEGAVVSGKQQSIGEFTTYCPLDLYPDLGEIFREKEVKVIVKPEGSGWGILFSFLPLLLFILLILFLMRRSQGGAGGKNGSPFSFAKSRARLFTSQTITTTFNDVAGVDEAKQELQEVVDFLKNSEKYRTLGARIPKGVLLTGPPGTGKTLIARAVAGEAGVPFFSISGSEFVEMFVGVGAARARDLFYEAKKSAPCIIFIDEIDAVGRHRGAGLGGGHDEREQTLNQILVEMDGFGERTNVIVLAATNRPDILDPALLRPGRFDRQVVLDLPDTKARKAILEIHARGKPIDPLVDFDKLAKQTAGFSGADLANLLNEAAILAARENKTSIGTEESEEAIDRVIAGPHRKSRTISKKEKEIAACHEAGHALVGWVLPNVDTVHKISIMARGKIGGYTRFLPEEDRYLWTHSQLQEMLSALLGGRIAEELVFGEPSTGAENDLNAVRKIAWNMVARYGMGKDLPLQAFGEVQEMIFLGKEISEHRDYGEEMANKIDKARIEIVKKAYDTARDILLKYRENLTEVSKKLVEEESIEGEALEKIFQPVPKNHWPLD